MPGRVGDACVAGGAAYADDEVGGCGSTGDGDLHLRFQPCYQASPALVLHVQVVPATFCWARESNFSYATYCMQTFAKGTQIFVQMVEPISAISFRCASVTM